MSSSALIDDLERQFAENPRRVFARLANEYRKSGDPERAIAICRAHVPQQPGYISGYIVLGQALFDNGRQDESQQAFQTAIELDPENLIALRQLGDISHQRNDLAGAREWYHRLLEVDPQNDDIAQLIADIEAAAEASYWTTPPERETPVPEAQFAEVEIEPVEAIGAPETSSHGGFALESNWGAESFRTEEPVDEFEPAAIVAESESVAPMADENIFASGSYFAPDAAEPEVEREVGPDVIDEEATLPFARPDAVEGESLLSISDLGTDDRDGSHEDETQESGGFVTETMAELYERQGFREQALEIYRALLGQRPHDHSLRERTAMLEAEIASADALPSLGDVQPSTNGVHHSWRSENARSFFGRIALRGVGSSGTVAVVPPEDTGFGQPFFGGARIGSADDAAGRSLAAAVAEGFGSPLEPHAGGVTSGSSDEHFQAWLQGLKK